MINKTNIIQGLFKEVKKSTKEVVSDLNDIVNNSETNYPNRIRDGGLATSKQCRRVAFSG